VPLTRNAFVRLRYVAVRQSEMLAWVMHDATCSSGFIAFFGFFNPTFAHLFAR
jgi:hypothetical protein